MRTFSIITAIFLSLISNAQVGIGNTNPGATLEISSNTLIGSTAEGILIPRVTRTKAQSMTGILESTVIFVNLLDGSATGIGTNIISKGFYYFDSSELPSPGKWVKFQTGNASIGWLLTGNTITDTDFLGSLNNFPLNFKVNNIKAGFIGNSSKNNVFLGLESGLSVPNTGIGSINNVAIGYRAMYSLGALGIGQQTAVGANAMYSDLSGTRNTAIGYNAAYSNTNGSDNVSVGHNALYGNIGGTDNVAIGLSSQFNSSGVGSFNSSVGTETLNNTSGSRNTAIGYRAFYSTSTLNWGNSTALGNNAIITASNQVRIGNSSVSSIGGQVGWTTLSDARFKRNIKENVPGIEFIKKLKPITYTVDKNRFNDFVGIDENNENNENNEDLIFSGFLAQDVEKVANQLGYNFSGVDKPKNENDYYGIRYAEFVVPLTKAIQEQQLLIESQQKTIEELKNEIDYLKEVFNKIINEKK